MFSFIKCEACQRRNLAHSRLSVPAGHVSAQRPFQRLAIGIVAYTSPSNNFNYVLSAINHLARFVILTLFPNKETPTIVRTLVDRVFLVLSGLVAF